MPASTVSPPGGPARQRTSPASSSACRWASTSCTSRSMAEARHPDIAGDSWVGVLIPAGTPKEIIALLHREIAKIIAVPDMRERLATVGFEPVVTTPEEFAKQMKVESAT